MCTQCLTRSRLLIKDVIPGFDLQQSQTDHPEWPKGWYGLVEMNDPTFVFPGPILPDTTDDLSDEVLNAMSEFPAGYDEYCAAADVLATRLVGDPMSGYRLVKACLEAGYSMHDDGHVHYWLMRYLSKKLPATSSARS